MRSLLREPLLHFALLAVLIFAAHAIIAPALQAPQTETITISAGRVQQMSAIFARTWQRPPTPEELRGLIDDFVLEEIYVRKALALGLDQDDTVIRRRLRQKMEFLADAEAEPPAPTKDELSAWLAANPSRFAQDPAFAFQQIFFNPDKRGAQAEADAAALLALLANDPGAETATLGDRSLLPARLALTPVSRITDEFGAGFAQALQTLPKGTWSGPIASAYGLHLVRLDQFRPGLVPPLDQIADAVLQAWTADRRDEISAARQADLRAGFTVTIQLPEAAQ